jgi:exodeoxyribonuclease-5
MEQAGITLTPHQQAAIDWLVAQMKAGEALLALRGLAGTGKTSVLPALQEALRAGGLPSVLGAPTHRAAMILRSKGLDADTLHSQALVSYFTADYRRACAWLGEPMPLWPGETNDAHEDVEGLPWLIYDALKPDLEHGKSLRRQRHYKARRRLGSIGIRGQDYFAGFGPKAGQGVLIIDEASMVGQQMLALCQQAYKQIILVGDPGQLPPVKDVAVLSGIPGVELTEIHRQAKESPILRLAYQAREGVAFWQRLHVNPLSVGEPVRAIDEVSARRFLTCPLLVWRNTTRTLATLHIRQALGYARDVLYKGEPLVCRATGPEDRAMGFFNNGLYTIREVSAESPRQVTVEDALGDRQTIQVHLEELDGEKVDPRAIPFRFGYALTVHTAQGGEWPRVYVSVPELIAHYGRSQHEGQLHEFQQFAYTAITRAKTTLRLLTHHTFTSHHERTTAMASPAMKPPSAPMLGNSNASPDIVPASPEEASMFGPEVADDIPDVSVPASLQETPQEPWVPGLEEEAALTQSPPTGLPERFGEHEALLQGALAHLMRNFKDACTAYAKDMQRPVDEIYNFVHDQMKIQHEKTRHAETVLDQVTTKIVQQGIQVQHDPYTVTVQSVSPQGFPVALHIAKRDKGELVEELGALVGWLAHNGYKPVGL